MHIPFKICFAIFATFCLPIISISTSFVQAFLYENGTCTDEISKDEISKETMNQIINTNGTVDDFLESLSSDNTILESLVCEDSSNQTILK